MGTRSDRIWSFTERPFLKPKFPSTFAQNRKKMRKSYILAAGLLLIATNLLSQEIDGFESDESQIPEEKTAIDTIDTEDKFVKIVLYDDKTWSYLDMGRPVIDDEIFFDFWDNDKIHAYKELSVSTIPDEVDLLLSDSLHSYCLPIAGPVRSRYAFRKTRDHNGIDISLNVGDSIYAAFDGKVRLCEVTRNSGGYGNLIVLRHSNGLETYYGHLSKILVKENELVKAGELIGLGGSTGRSTGPHLHFETRYQGQSFDPERIIDFETGELRMPLVTLKKHYFSIYSHYGQTDEESYAASQRILHTIRSGDTLGALANKYGTTVSKICKLNGFSSKTILRVGHKIIVR